MMFTSTYSAMLIISLECWYFLALLYLTAEEQWLSSVYFTAFMSLTCWPFF